MFIGIIASALTPYFLAFVAVTGFTSTVYSKAGSTYFEDYRKEQRKLFCLDLID